MCDSIDNRSKVIVGQNHIGSIFGHICPSDAHGNADVGSFERWRIIDAVTGHGDHRILFLPSFDDSNFITRGSPREHADISNIGCQILVAHLAEVMAGDRLLAAFKDANVFSNGFGRTEMIPSDHNRCNAGLFSSANGSGHFRARRINDTNQSQRL